jgi:D-tyrosyl-tRNA(Tyr) deacylase
MEMRALLQRVASASVTVNGQTVGSIDRGLLVLVGIHKDDTPADGDWLAAKILQARIFEDDAGKMNRSITDIAGELLIVSQFTLYGDLRKGTRPSFSDSMPGEAARVFYANWVAKLRNITTLKIEKGRFAENMQVALINNGPVTLLLDSRD